VTEYCHVDGRVVPVEEAAVGVHDRGFRYADAAATTVRAYGGEPFEWAACVGRLRRAAARLGFEQVLPPVEDLHERLTETLDANDLTEAAVRIAVTRGSRSRGLTPPDRVAPTVVLTADPLPRGGTDGDRAWTAPATLRTVEQRRPPADALAPELQQGGGLPGLLARLELPAVADEALLRTVEGHVTDGAASDLFLVHDGTLYAPTADLPFPAGVVRGVVLDIASGESFPVETGRYTVTDVREADELFLTSPAWELRPVTDVDGYATEVGPITRLCSRLFDERVERAHYG
jgi:branched-chain amino acid aminotransferase